MVGMGGLMKPAGVREFESYGLSIKIYTFLIEEDEEPAEFLEKIKNMYPDAEIRIPRAKTEAFPCQVKNGRKQPYCKHS